MTVATRIRRPPVRLRPAPPLDDYMDPILERSLFDSSQVGQTAEGFDPEPGEVLAEGVGVGQLLEVEAALAGGVRAEIVEQRRAQPLADSAQLRVAWLHSAIGKPQERRDDLSPFIIWHTSDREEYHGGIRQWLREAALPNTPEPLLLDVRQPRWPSLPVDAVFSANTTHIMHWPEVEAQMRRRLTQTNEAGRCAVLLPVLAALPQPLALLEVGASAGLCLYPDRYAYRYDGGPTVGQGEPLLDCATTGLTPPRTRPEVAVGVASGAVHHEPDRTARGIEAAAISVGHRVDRHEQPLAIGRCRDRAKQARLQLIGIVRCRKPGMRRFDVGTGAGDQVVRNR